MLNGAHVTTANVAERKQLLASYTSNKYIIILAGFYSNVIGTAIEPTAIFVQHKSESNRIILSASNINFEVWCDPSDINYAYIRLSNAASQYGITIIGCVNY